jgi:hypothetical protein
MQRKVFSLTSFWLCCFFLSACGRTSQLERKEPEDVSRTKAYFEMLRAVKYDEVEKTLDPSLKDEDFRVTFDAMVGTIPAENPLSARTTVAERRCTADYCIVHVVVEYAYTDELLLFNVAFRHSGAQVSTVGIHIHIVPKSFIAANEFRFANKGVTQYAILLTVVVVVLFSLYAVVACIRSNIGLRKWLWVPFILLGVGRLGVNWATGELGFQIGAIQLLSADAIKQELYGPWTLYVSLPLGALLFVATHRTDWKRSGSGNRQK